MSKPSVVVIGGGIAGLAAAYELTGGPSVDEAVRVTILEREQTPGGALQTTSFAGRTIDLGADGFLATRREATDLIRDIGRSDELEPIGASGAWIYLHRGLEAIPKGLVLGVPTRFAQVRSLRGLSLRAKWGSLRDFVAPRSLSIGDDATIGQIVRAKLGSALVDQLVEPMIGGIQAGRVDDLSAATVFPALLAAAKKGGSLQRAIRPPHSAAPPGPLFYSLRDGLGSLPTHLATVLQERGVTFHYGEAATYLARGTTRRWSVATARTVTEADAVVITTPPQVAGELLAPHSPAGESLRKIPSASAAMVTFAVARADINLPASGTGVLVPLQTPHTANESMIVTAITLLDRKWPHLADDDSVLVRVHTGRIDDGRSSAMSDDELITRVNSELRQILGSWPTPITARVQRWPHALPQYHAGHAELVRTVRHAAEEIGIWLAGMTYDGVGVPASIGSGRLAGQGVRRTLL